MKFYSNRLCQRLGFIVFAGLLATPAFLHSSSTLAGGKVNIRILSSRADMVTGGDALLEITGVETTPARPTGNVTVTANGRDQTSAFRVVRPGAPFLGRITSLVDGRNAVEVRAGGSIVARFDLTNHPITGPVFSGPHQTPFSCQTEGAGLGVPLDTDCSAKTVVAYLYKSAAGFKPYDPAAPRPADLAQTTTTEGLTVDFIVRRERGVINRAIYEIAFLHLPREPIPDPWMKSHGWNGRLVYEFGGGCATGYRQGAGASAVNEALLAGGYAVAASTLNVFGNNCDDVVSAETMMMVKEHFIEQFGVPMFTIGTGASGGAMQQHLIAQNYPGLLDGLTPGGSFPDFVTVASGVDDCWLLAHAFENAKQTWADDQKTAVSGFGTFRTCTDSWMRGFPSGLIRPAYCPPNVAVSLVYDPLRNPKGTRCTFQDNQVNVYTRDPKTGFARRPLDNVGVQYGLGALNKGIISVDQFLELNERVGGYDVDGNLVETRTVADPVALRLAYETGRVNTAGGSLGAIPIIDSRQYVDATGNIHDSVRSFVTRARLVAATGRADNHVILRLPNNASGATAVDPIRMMDAWLAAIMKDQSSDAAAVKAARNKPADVRDACYTAAGERIAEPASYTGTSRCNQLYPPYADPRIAAGGPLTDDILKCELKRIDRKDYTQPFTAAQISRLNTLFPKGVCDYSRPGVEQRRVRGDWKLYQP